MMSLLDLDEMFLPHGPPPLQQQLPQSGLNLSTNHGLDLTCPNHQGLNLSVQLPHHEGQGQDSSSHFTPHSMGLRTRSSRYEVGLNLSLQAQQHEQRQQQGQGVGRGSERHTGHGDVKTNFYNGALSKGYINLSSSHKSHPTNPNMPTEINSPLNLERRASPLNLTQQANFYSHVFAQNPQQAQHEGQQHFLAMDSLANENNFDVHLMTSYINDQPQQLQRQRQQPQQQHQQENVLQQQQHQVLQPQSQQSDQSGLQPQPSCFYDLSQNSNPISWSTGFGGAKNTFDQFNNANLFCQDFFPREQLGQQETENLLAMGNPMGNNNSTSRTTKEFASTNNVDSANCPMVSSTMENVCSMCQEAFGSGPDLKKHLDLVHQGRRSDTSMHNTVSSAGNTLKESDQMITKGLNDKVVKKPCIKVFKCKLCSRTFKSHQNMRKHFRKVHEGQVSVQCEECGQFYFDEHDLKRHMECHRKSNALDRRCDTCGRIFGSSKARMRHLRDDNCHFEHECDICGLRMETKVQWGFHMWRHTKNAKYIVLKEK